jgi:hypothetical protein
MTRTGLSLSLCLMVLTTVQALDEFNTYTSVGEIGLTITNFGVIGHGYNIEGQPSCLYKQYSELDFEQVEHFSYGGLWVGGVVDGEARVTTGVMDGTFAGRGWEWNNIGIPADADPTDPAYAIQQQSTFTDSPNFRPDAVSHQDFLISYTDTSLVVPESGELIEDHSPLGLRVDLSSHAWNYSYADAFVIMDMTITNISEAYDPDGEGWIIDSLHVGYWIDEAVGNFNLNDYYSPGRGGWSWYDNLSGMVLTDSTSTALGDTIRMAVGYDVDGDNGYSESMLGCRYIGGSAPHVSDPRRIEGRAYSWIWNSTYNQDFPLLLMPTNDAERFSRMATTLEPDDFPYGGENSNSWMMLSSAGSFGRLEPGESLNAVFTIACGRREFVDPTVPTGPERLQKEAKHLIASTNWAKIAWDGEDKNGDGELSPDEDLDGDGILDRYLLPMPPPGPRLHVEVGDREMTLYWNDSPERFVDPILGETDFEGYRVYSNLRTPGADAARTLVAQFDLVDEIWPNTGLEDIKVRNVLGVDADSVEIDGRWYQYAFHMENLLTGRPQGNWVAISAYDRGLPQNNLPSLESDVKENWVYVFPGSLPSDDAASSRKKPGVYPNPYRGHASWDGSGAYERLLWFTHLPARCTVTIYTLAGDLVDSFEHDSNEYTGEDVALIRDTRDQVSGSSITDTPFIFSGGEHAWDLVSQHDQAIATGLYMFTVEDHNTGQVDVGKFAVIK